MILVGEPLPELRVISVRLVDVAGIGLSSARTWIAGEVRVRHPGAVGGAFVDAMNLPIAVTGSAPGSFDLQLELAEVAAPGRIRILFVPTGGQLLEVVEEVRPHPLEVVLDPLAAVGEGRTAAECINLAAAYASGDARGLDGPVGSIDSLASDAAQRVKRIEFTIQSGKRTITKRRGA